MSIHVQLAQFEGPLGLLLYLIRQEEMDIFDINVHQVTRQYLEYIKAMKKLDLEVAGEFVSMAATLIHIKSRMLLPNYTEEGEEVEAEDPRKELVQKLLEYQKFQEVSQRLYELPLLNRDVYQRGRREELQVAQVGDGEILTEDNALYSLIRSYRFVVKNFKVSVHKVAEELQSIASRVLEVKDKLLVGIRVTFSDLLDQNKMNLVASEDVTAEQKAVERTNHVLVTFLSLLELAKMGFISVFQSGNFEEIHIETKKTIDRDVISQVEDYDDAVESSPEDEVESSAPAGVSSAQKIMKEDFIEPQQTVQLELSEESLQEITSEDPEPEDVVNSSSSGVEESAVENAPSWEQTTPVKYESFSLFGNESVSEETAATDEDILAEELKLEGESNTSDVVVQNVEAEPLEDLNEWLSPPVSSMNLNSNDPEENA